MWSLPEIRMSARNRFLLLAGMFVFGVLAVTHHLSELSIGLVETAARESARNYAEALRVVRSRYTSEVVNRVKSHGIEVTHAYQLQQAAIPLPATLTIDIGEHIGRAEGGVRISLYSDAPFPWRKDRQLDSFQRRAWEQLRSKAGAAVEEFDWERRILRFATPDVLQRSCVNCHNSHPDTPRSNWKQGDVRGVLEVSLPLDSVISQTKAGLHQTFLLMVGLGLLGLFALLFVMAGVRSDSTRLRRQARETEAALDRQRATNRALDIKAAELENLNTRITETHRATRDANVRLANQARELTQAQQTISEITSRLSLASRKIIDATRTQTHGAAAHAASVHKIATTIEDLARSAENASTGAQRVADSARHMEEVGRVGRIAVTESSDAMAAARTHMTDIVTRLNRTAERAQSIGDITATVSELAEQTHLLAINAAIEASHAGEHGRGFSVVAAEIKSLAEQSRRSTARVIDILNDIQSAIYETVTAADQGASAIQSTSKVIQRADNTIAQLTNAVAGSTRQAYEISLAARQTAHATSQVSEGINHIGLIATEHVRSTEDITAEAEALAALTQQLQASASRSDAASD
jgi:methyl-accepting chemotaxis protein